MKVQLSCLIALALLGASMTVQFADAAAAVCPDECTAGGRNGVKMCKNGKDQCITKPKQQRNIIKKGGKCGVCSNDNGNGNKKNRNWSGGVVSNDGPFPKCSEYGEVDMCYIGGKQGVRMCNVSGKKDMCVRDSLTPRKQALGHSCGVCRNGNDEFASCSASNEAVRCVDDNGARGFYMFRDNKTSCVKDRLTIAKQNNGHQCGCFRGVCPSACPAANDCDNGDGSYMCLNQSNYGSNKICVDKSRVQTKQDLGLGTCGPC